MKPSYPAQIETQLASITNVIEAILQPKSILLLGSAARGELSYHIDDQGQIEYFSDYEFLIVTTKSPDSDQRRALAVRLQALENQIDNPNPLFHVDAIIRNYARLHTLPPLIFTFEMKRNAQVRFGADVRSEIPEVTLKNLDYRNTNEILYKRLWAILLHLPKRFIVGGLSQAERHVTGYILCRNVLDIATVLLPSEQVLLPTYQQRVTYLKDHYLDLSFHTMLGVEFPNFIEICLHHRLNLTFSDMDMLDWYKSTIKYLQRALTHLLPGNTKFEALPQHSRIMFNEWPISRGEWYNLSRVALHLFKSRGPKIAGQWLQKPKKGWLTIGLLAMHQSLISWLQGDAVTAQQQLEQAHIALNHLSLTVPTKPTSTDFPKQWLHLRHQWGSFWQAYIRLGDSKYAHRFANITEWHHD